MINIGLQVRRAVAEDHQQLANLIFFDANTHRHLDWRSPLEWLGSPNYWVLEDHGQINAVLACPEDPPQLAWIRLFGYRPQQPSAEAWSALWEVASREVSQYTPQTQIASIVVKQWFHKILLSSGFEIKQSIVLLQLLQENVRKFPLPHSFRIRTMQEEDLPVVAEIDFDAFGWFWHNTHDALRRARLQAVHATVAEDASGVIGYQISTGSMLGAHLARLGVGKTAQGRGVGTALVNDLIQALGSMQINRLSVNTQSDNSISLALYKKMGFVRTGESFPVLIYPGG